jgi:hypothetical protein
LRRLIAEQAADNEPAPFDDGPSDSPPRKVHTRKRL